MSQLSADRKRKLDDSLLFAQFNQEYSESQGWIEDRLKNVTDESFGQVVDLHDKMRKLQKHQAFEAEIMANAPRIKHIKEVSIKVHLISFLMWLSKVMGTLTKLSMWLNLIGIRFY